LSYLQSEESSEVEDTTFEVQEKERKGVVVGIIGKKKLKKLQEKEERGQLREVVQLFLFFTS
jgi:hypothetical protein